ncbi:MAG: hypothetical protein WC205_11590 [Opitutaceae bacterium]
MLILVGIVAVFSVISYLAWKYERERTEAIGVLAVQLGWRFYGKEKNRDFSDERPQFECFQRGNDRFAYNCLVGKLSAFDRELRAEAGDYHYEVTSGSGKERHTTTYQFSYLLVDLPFGPRLPSLVVRPEGLFDKLAGVIGFEDIDFESAEFSKRYHVSSSDRRFTYNLIDPRMIEFLLDVGPPRIELSRGTLLIVADQARTRWAPEDFAGAVEWTNDFLARWPAFLVKDLSAS